MAEPPSEHVRRFVDILVAASMLAFASPLIAVIALATLFETGRPVLFEQTRLGQHGRPFRILKFRKFHNSALSGSPLTLERDARLTRVGRWLQTSKLDELPQLLNVLRGDMAIIGPRPESLAFADCFQAGFEAILRHKPGILGPSQAAFRRESDFYPGEEHLVEFYRQVLFPLKALVDLKYYPSRTLASDLMWLGVGILATIGIETSLVPFREMRWRNAGTQIRRSRV